MRVCLLLKILLSPGLLQQSPTKPFFFFFFHYALSDETETKRKTELSSTFLHRILVTLRSAHANQQL